MEKSGRVPLLPQNYSPSVPNNGEIQVQQWKKHYDKSHVLPHQRKLIFFICFMVFGAFLYLLIAKSCLGNPDHVLILQTRAEFEKVVQEIVKNSGNNAETSLSTPKFTTITTKSRVVPDTMTYQEMPSTEYKPVTPQRSNPIIMTSVLSSVENSTAWPPVRMRTIKTFARTRAVRSTTYSLSNDMIFQKPTTEIPSIFSLDKTGCHLPKLQPFDPTILEFIEDPEPIRCEDDYHPLVFETDLESNLIANSVYAKFTLQNCCYRDLFRAENPLLHSEDVIRYKPQCTPITQNITQISAPHEHIGVFCNNGTEIASNFSQNYKLVDIFGLTPLKAEVEERIQKVNKTKTDEKLSLLVLGLDSLSHMNFLRTMPKTVIYLNETLFAIGMNGYVKVGDNTFPNLVPVLTGLNVSELEESCWEDPNMELDGCPFIWKTYSEFGYRTSYAEDAPWMGTFNYGKRGFDKAPTDYYLRPLLFAQEDEIGHERPLNANLCYGPRLAIDILLDNIKKLATTMASERKGGLKQYFQWIWSTTFTHDDLNSPKLVDEPVLSTLTFLHERGFLNHTILVLMSDHGIRWGDIRSTRQGKIEERMPFLYFVFPPWFRQKYKSAISNLKTNQDRLSTPFDFYETLVDLVSPEDYISDEEIEVRQTEIQNQGFIPRGISLFLPIPTSRTCKMAEIAEHWCVCHSSTPIFINSSIVASAAESVIRHLNDMIQEYTQCAQLQLSRVLNAEILELENKELQSDDNDKDNAKSTLSESETLEITFEVLPSLGIFESTLRRESNFENDWTVVGDISRTNAYGNQSHCVTDYSVKKYCYCQLK